MCPPRTSRTPSWTTSTSLAGPTELPGSLRDLDLVEAGWAFWWVDLFALTELLTPLPFIDSIAAITASTDGDYMLRLPDRSISSTAAYNQFVDRYRLLPTAAASLFPCKEICSSSLGLQGCKSFFCFFFYTANSNG